MPRPTISTRLVTIAAAVLAVHGSVTRAGADPECGQWTEWSPDSAAFARYAHVMVYAPTLDRLVIFGGVDDAGTWHQDVWTMTLDATPTATG